jgi:Zn-dependent protease with chaperone function
MNPADDSGAMAAGDDPAKMAERLAQLEKDVLALRARIAQLERQLDPRSEHPSDRSAVREKVAYDWQA